MDMFCAGAWVLVAQRKRRIRFVRLSIGYVRVVKYTFVNYMLIKVRQVKVSSGWLRLLLNLFLLILLLNMLKKGMLRKVLK